MFLIHIAIYDISVKVFTWNSELLVIIVLCSIQECGAVFYIILQQ